MMVSKSSSWLLWGVLTAICGCASEKARVLPAVPRDAVARSGSGEAAEIVPVTSNLVTSNPAATAPPTRPASFVSRPEQVPADSPPSQPPAAAEQWREEAGFGNVLELNLPTALSLVGGDHPAVGLAQWRVREAYAQLEQARVLWLPSIRPGFSFHKHDGRYQASNGQIVDVDRNSLQYGLGTGATGAGTTPRPGLAAQFHLADALFQPAIAQKSAWARGHAARGVVNLQLMLAAVAYFELVAAEQELEVVEASRERAQQLLKLTADFAAAGQGLQADADRVEVELRMVENRVAAAEEQVQTASARLAEALSIDACQRLVPLDPTVVPLELVACDGDQPDMIRTGLQSRPELKEAQALVAVACEQYRRQQYAPFVPSVLLGYSAGGFGGGLGGSFDDDGRRYDFDALVAWEVRNLGFGEQAARRETRARVQQSRFDQLRLMDQVAREVSEAYAQVQHRRQRVAVTRGAIEAAENSFQRNLGRIRDGQGLPLEALQSVQALEEARRAYLRAVVDYNSAQIRLQWAMGWPIDASAAGEGQPPAMVGD